MKKLVIANWKMNPNSLSEAKKLFSSIKKQIKSFKKSKIVICPPSIYLQNLVSISGKAKIEFGAQNISNKAHGSFTGEISAKMIYDSGARYVILGHSERRKMGEDDIFISEKVLLALESKIKPIVCVGESKRDREGEFLSFLENQIEASLSMISKDLVSKIIVAYEPIWAIGKTALDAIKPDQVQQMYIFIKKVLVSMYGKDTAEKIKIIYGGSVEPSNVSGLTESGVDGFLVGHASLKASYFNDILKNIDEI